MSKKLVGAAIQFGLIEVDNRNVYEYAVTSFLFCLVTWGTLFVFGLFTKQLPGCGLFLLFYVPLRIHAGGYHQKAMLKCYISSCCEFLIVIAGAINPYAYFFCLVNIVLLLYSVPAIWYMAPLPDENKPLPDSILTRNKKRTRIILILQLCLIGILYLIGNLSLFVYYACVALNAVAILLTVGKLLSKKYAAQP